jgi:2Fe-2S ferredoxin
MITIKFTGVYEGRKYDLESHKNEYRNLMVLLKDQICPEDFGQCGGMGRCGTCLVKVLEFTRNSEIFYRNEQGTLQKMGIIDPKIRLSCQIQVDEDLNNVFVELQDNI